jgi:hypothetical protein
MTYNINKTNIISCKNENQKQNLKRLRTQSRITINLVFIISCQRMHQNKNMVKKNKLKT